MKCKNCQGDGWTEEHDPLDDHVGGVCKKCPIQVQCNHCFGSGRICSSCGASILSGDLCNNCKYEEWVNGT